MAGWLLGVHWFLLAGWRWLFILEGIPAIVLGVITLFYLTDWPAQARWLLEDEREWLVNELRSELDAKKKIQNHTILQAFLDRRVAMLTAAWFLSLTGTLGSIYWIPTLVKRLSGLSDRAVTSLLLLPALLGIAGMLLNARHSDRTGERRWHTALPLFASGLMFELVLAVHQVVPVAILLLLLGSGIFFAFYPVFWSIPTMMLSEAAAAATFGLINSFGQCGGFAGPFVIGLLNDTTHSLNASFAFIGLVYLAAGAVTLTLKVKNPLAN